MDRSQKMIKYVRQGRYRMTLIYLARVTRKMLEPLTKNKKHKGEISSTEDNEFEISMQV